ncbi:hypothetical protein [Pelagicoccus sp. SDUM812003]|uniref:hypothetical protein n=1 Tax=Pelagicoccus sp. SDUM812003 TaxID=3041267 RepID=UPI00280CE105|nr:hypothetical protein [Pelagicoccus sp. SDUM812003]MDQ8203286.1 hypothetical protein [Pelagicoccus sp. SDUM812003]
MTEIQAPSDPKALIDKAMAENRLAHALLIHGQNLAQVERFAIELSCRLLGVSATPEQLEEKLFRHPDVFTLRPSKKSRVISVDDTREAIRNIQHSPQAGERKVAIIFEVDRFNTSAANAFLKTLEEPPLNTTILLLTTRPHSLLATIRSRCQLFRLPTGLATFDDPTAQEWLAAYRQWLSDLLTGQPGGKQCIPHFIIGAYGLVERFSHIIQTLGKTAWKAQSEKLPEDMSDDERIALESRISISIRQDFLAAVESSTEQLAREKLFDDSSVPIKLVESVEALEKTTHLLRLNMKTEAVLESFLLQALRIWTAKG